MKVERVQTKSDVQRVVRESGGTPPLVKEVYQEMEKAGTEGFGLYVRYTNNFLQKMRVSDDLLERPDIDTGMQREDIWTFNNGVRLKNWVEPPPEIEHQLTVLCYVIKTGDLSVWTGRQFRLEQTAKTNMDQFIFFYANISTEEVT